MAMQVGDKAPDFTVETHDKSTFTLSQMHGNKNVVLYFYPADFTPVCTKETCGFRDMAGELENQDTVVLGISPDSNETHEKFAQKHNVSFALVSDPQFVLAEKFELFTGVRGTLAKLTHRFPRVTYVIDREGDIRGVFKSELLAGTHLSGVRELIAQLSNRT